MKKLLIGLMLLVSMSSFASLNDIREEFQGVIEEVATKVYRIQRACAGLQRVTVKEAAAISEKPEEYVQIWKVNNCLVNKSVSLNDLRIKFGIPMTQENYEQILTESNLIRDKVKSLQSELDLIKIELEGLRDDLNL